MLLWRPECEYHVRPVSVSAVPTGPDLMCGTNAKSATFVYRNTKNNGEYFLGICSHTPESPVSHSTLPNCLWKLGTSFQLFDSTQKKILYFMK